MLSGERTGWGGMRVLMVALNPDAPLEVLEALADDSDLLVRFVSAAQMEQRVIDGTHGETASSVEAIRPR